MWLFTPIGFFSIVQNRDDRTQVMIRARKRSDLDALRTKFAPLLGRTIRTPEGDYPYRAFMGKREFAKALERIGRKINYENFKATVRKSQGERREDLYHDVWAQMRRLEKM